MRLGWIPVIALLLLPAIPVAGQETAEDPAVARSRELFQSIVTLGKASDTKELVERWLQALRSEFGPEHPTIRKILNRSARSLYERGVFDGARQLFERVFELSTQILGKEHPDTWSALANLAVTLKAQGDLVGARQREEEVLEARRRTLGPEHPDTLTASANLAVTLQAQGDLAGARQRSEEVLEARQRIFGHEHPDTLIALGNLAVILRVQGDLAGARQREEEVLKIRRRILGPEHPHTLNALANLAGTLQEQGDLVGAKQRHQEVAEALRRVLGPEHPNTLIALGNLAETLNAQGDLIAARQRYEEVLEAHQKILGPSHVHTLVTLGRLAEILKAQGDLIGARQREEEVLEALRRTLGPEHPNTLVALANLAGTLQAQGDLVGARQLLEEALDAFRRTLGPEHPDTLATLLSLAVASSAQGDLVGARQRQEEVLAAFRRILGPEHPKTLIVLGNLAGTLREQGDLVGARQHEEEVLEVRRRILGDEHPATLGAMHNLAGTLKNMGAVDQARRLLEQVVESRAKQVNGASPDSTEEAVTLYELATIHRDAGRLEEASRFFNAALDALEGQADRFDLSEDTKSRFRSDYRNAYHATIDLALRRNQAHEAFHTLERYRAQSLLTLLLWGQPQSAGAAMDSSARDGIARRSDQILHELAQLDPEMERDRSFALLAERSQLQRQREALWYQRMQDRREGEKLAALKVDEIRPHLDPGTLLLAYHVTDSGTDLFAVTREGPLEVYRLPVTEPELWLQLVRYFPLLLPTIDLPEPENPEETTEVSPDPVDPEALVRLGRWLYEKLLAKAGKRIVDSQRLLILPDGPLYYLPFAAVLAPASDKPSGWQYLTEWKPIHTAQSATVYAELQQRRKTHERATPTLVALGNPSYPPTPPRPTSQDSNKGGDTRHLPFAVRSMVDRGLFDGLLPLPNTAREIDGIAGLFPKDQAQTYLGDEATEDRAKQELKTARYVHLAAHGLANPENPLDSFLALTIPETWTADKNNGILQAWEVIDHLHLDADLVVLSACVTAFGPALGGEGLMSLARAFQIAGARSVAASLWRVADESTAELMIRFYRHLIQDGMPKDEALRAAQMELIRGPIEVTLEDGTDVERDFSAPYHWAAFQLIGDWQ